MGGKNIAKFLYEERVVEYTKGVKVKVVGVTEGLNVQVVEIADILGLPPVMAYRWRQEFREGDLTYSPSRRVSMTNDKPKIKEKRKRSVGKGE